MLLPCSRDDLLCGELRLDDLAVAGVGRTPCALGLALALDAAELRDDLRLLVMSATLDGARVVLREATA